MTARSAIADSIWDMKYRLKEPDGTPVDATIEDSFRRVARALASVETNPEHWAEVFYDILANFEFLPAGRILAGAGADRKVTLFNCFVMGAVPDDMGGIFAHLREAALTLQQGGGIGYDFSTLRPRGAPVAGVGADASGPLSFMDVWDAMCRTIMSAGSRRGAMMATLRCDHPDIEAFIEAKREPGRLRNFNLSVLATDAFMTAVQDDAPWDLRFDGVVYRTLRARDLWDRIMTATYAYAEPGVIFIDRVNQQNNLAYCETIHATNPCVTADSWIQTEQGPEQVSALVGRPFRAVVDGAAHDSDPRGFFSTGRKPVLRLATTQGYELRATSDHPVRKVTERTRWRLEWRWTPLADLAPGDQVMLNDLRAQATWSGDGGTEEEGYLLGLLIGDGTLKAEDAVLSVWRSRPCADGTQPGGVDGVMTAALAAARTLPHRADFQGWFDVEGRQESRLKLRAVRRLAARYGMDVGRKTVTPEIERASSGFYCGLLRGLFDSDGSIQGDREKGVSVRLSQSDEALLRAAQRMLLRLGIVSTLYLNRRPAETRNLPNGDGGVAPYFCAAQHELVIARENLQGFQSRIGFADDDKALRLKTLMSGYRRTVNRERFTATIAALEPAGEEAVFDACIPGVNAFDANGLVVHNCGEQPLPEYGACLLGSVNLARMVTSAFEEGADVDLDRLQEVVRAAVRLMDNVVDASRFPLPAQEKEARDKRRIGLGVTGLGDALILCGLRYGEPAAVTRTETWMRVIRDAAYEASVDLAKEKGAFPRFDRDAMLARPFIEALPEAVQNGIARHGLRNALLTSIAPTGTISLFADNVSSGIEPVFAFTYTRAVLQPDGSRTTETVSDYAYRLFRERFGEDAPLPPAFVDAQTLTPSDHLAMQAAAQRYVDSAISKTINCPADISFEAFRDIYAQAYAMGCKGCTTYRPNDITGSVLAVTPSEEQKPIQLPAITEQRPLARPETLPGQTYKIRWADSDHALYITINDLIMDGRRRPFEIFINSKNMEHYAWTVALTRMISAVFRRGGDVSFVAEELKAVFDPRGGQWFEGRYVPSLLAAIGDVILRHLEEIGFIAAGTLSATPAAPAQAPVAADAPRPGATPRPGRACPRCGQPTLIAQEGCLTCLSCGYSKCS